ncbi:hypothetical protein RNJ44_03737 [Nakaseomyces bracarensis]|uniref:CST complex subunit Stn1 N-terminal domain-containing protein n=1 Tax=Nakaseomyces bracarensis TaxID=273131 RepID=A0ABR4NY03_9SACH
MQHDDLVVGEIAGLKYYVAGLFRFGEVYGRVMSVSVRMVMEMVANARRCGRLYDHKVTCLFWKNHPVRKLCVMGIVVGVKYTWIKDEDHAIVLLDDCSDSQIMSCRLEVNYLRSFGINVSNGFVGSRVMLTGTYSLEYREFVVQHIEVMKSTLSIELEFWTTRDVELLSLSDWAVQLPQMDSMYEDINTKTPRHKPPETLYIEYLQAKNVRDELIIASPYREDTYDESMATRAIPDSLSSSKNQDDPDHSSKTHIIDIEIESYDVMEKRHNNSRAIEIRSIKALRREILRFILGLDLSQVSKLELYNNKGISAMIDNYATYQFQQQHVMNPIKCKDFKSLSFDDCIQQLIDLHIIQYTDSKEVNIGLQSLQIFKNYVVKKISLLVKLENLLGYIQYDDVREKTIKSLSDRVILFLFKESLKTAVSKYMAKTVAHWYIDNPNDQGFTIHLQYH